MSRYANRTLQPKPATVSRKSADNTGKGAVVGTTSSNSVRGQVNSMAIQAKLKVSSAYDPAEAEADNAAREVVHGKTGNVAAGAAGGTVQAKPLVSRISRQVQRAESNEELQMQRSEEEMQMQRSEEEMQMQRSEEDMQMQRSEEDMQMQRSEEDMQMQRSEEEMQMQRSEEEMQMQRSEEDMQMQRSEEEMQMQRSEEEMQMQRSEEEMQMQRSEEEMQMQRSEEEMQMQRSEEEMQMQRSEEDMQMQRSEEEVQAKCANCGGEMQLQREEDEAQLQREEDEMQAKCADCEAKEAQREEDDLQAKSAPEPVNHKQGFTTTQETTDKVLSRKGNGDALPSEVMAEMETGFGADFSGINIHTDSASAELNREVKAKAFTTGSDVFFGQGQFDPGSEKGKELIAHELTHTIQQGEAPAKETTPEKPSTETASGATSAETSPELVTEAANQAAEAATAELSPTETPVEGEASPAVEAEGVEPEAMEDSEAADAEKEAEAAADKAAGAEGEEEAAEKEGGGGGGGGGALPTGGEYDLDDNSGRTNIVDKVSERAATAGDREKNGGETAQHLETESAEVCPNAMESTQELADAESDHQPVDEKVGEIVEAEEIGEDFGEAEGQNTQVAGLETDAQNADEVKGDEASKALEGALDDNTPTTMEDLDEYDASEAATAVTEKMAPQVTTVKNTFGRIESEDPQKVAQRKAEGLPGPEAAEEVDKMKLGEGAVPEVPEAMTDMSEYDDDFNGALEKEGITQEQLDMVDSGPLAEARGERDGIREKVESAPGELQGFAAKQQAGVEGEMDKEEDKTRKDMGKERDDKLKKVEQDQKDAKGKFEKERSWVSVEVDNRYKAVETKIKNRLDKLEKENEKKFFKKVAQFSEEFEDQVNEDVNDYLDERQSGALGFIVAGYDWLAGIDDHPEVIRAFEKAREDYIKKIDDEIKLIADETNKVIEECKTWLKDGKKDIEDWLADLPEDQQVHAKEAAKEMDKKFKELDKFIDKKKEELVAKLCQMKEKAIEHIDAKIEKMKEEMAGAIAKALLFLIDAALSFFTWALETVGYDMAKIKPQISKTRATLKEIVMHPMAFMGNLIDATGKGFNQFGDNIKKHMISGLVNWMTGTMGDVDIQLPETWNPKGFGMFFLEILGVSWNVLRQKLGRFIPEEVISFAEGSVGMVKALIKDGPLGMWKEIQNEMGAIKEQIMESVREMLVFELVKKGITHLLSMLIPGAGFVKAIIAIYDIIMFFVENWDSIVQLVMTIFKSVGDIAMGKLGKAANFIESAMGMTIPIMFNFLARLLHLGAFGKKIQKAIKKVRGPIDKIIDKALKKIAKIARKLFGGGKKKKGGKNKKGGKDKKDGLTAKDRKKHKKIGGKVIAELEKVDKKDFKDFKTFYNDRKKKAKKLEAKYGPKVKKKVKGKTIKLSIDLVSLAKDEKDGDVDFKVKIAPNDYHGKGAAKKPGGAYDPKQRNKTQLWKDINPANKLFPEETEGQSKKRAQKAKKELPTRYSGASGQVVANLAKENHGKLPRRITSLAQERKYDPNAHTHKRHVLGAKQMRNERALAVRNAFYRPWGLGGSDQTGAFSSESAAVSGLNAAISKRFNEKNWPRNRAVLFGLKNIQFTISAPSSGVVMKRLAPFPPNPRKIIKDFHRHEYLPRNSSMPMTPNPRILIANDPKAPTNRGISRKGWHPLDRTQPLVGKLSPKKVEVRMKPLPNARGGFAINSSWPKV